MMLNVLFIPGLGGDVYMWEAVASDMSPQLKLHFASPLKGDCIADLARTILMNAPDKFVAPFYSVITY